MLTLEAHVMILTGAVIFLIGCELKDISAIRELREHLCVAEKQSIKDRANALYAFGKISKALISLNERKQDKDVEIKEE